MHSPRLSRRVLVELCRCYPRQLLPEFPGLQATYPSSLGSALSASTMKPPPISLTWNLIHGFLQRPKTTAVLGSPGAVTHAGRVRMDDTAPRAAGEPPDLSSRPGSTFSRSLSSDAHFSSNERCKATEFTPDLPDMNRDRDERESVYCSAPQPSQVPAGQSESMPLLTN